MDAEGQIHDFPNWQSLPITHSQDALPIVDGYLRIPRVLQLVRYERLPG